MFVNYFQDLQKQKLLQDLTPRTLNAVSPEWFVENDKIIRHTSHQDQTHT